MPRILTYNPTCEIAIGKKADTYSAPPHLAIFERDMAQIMMYMSQEGDMVAAPQPDAKLTQMIERAGLRLPTFCTLAEAKAAIAGGATLQPWGKCRPVFRTFGMRSEAVAFDETKRRLHSRLTSVELESIITQTERPDYMLTGLAPEVISTDNLLTEEALAQRLPMVLKSVWSSSGRGVMLVRDRSQLQQALTFAQGRVRHDGAIIAEPLLKRLGECSFLFRIGEDGSPEYLGCNTFEADEQGNFGIEVIGDSGHDLLPTDWKAEAAEVLTRVLTEWHKRTGYEGYIGFDAMTYEQDGYARLRLCTEANLRICMGNINLGVSRLFAPSVRATWTIHHFGQRGEALRYCHEQELAHPLRTSADGKIESGFFCLTSVGEETMFAACGVATV